jgi:hypothetical protein
MPLFANFLYTSASGGVQTLDLRIIIQLSYNCATTASHNVDNQQKNNVWHFLPLFSIPVPVEGFKPLILGLLFKCPTAVLPLLAIMLIINKRIMYALFATFYTGVSGGIWTLDLGIMSWAFYHCAVATSHNVGNCHRNNVWHFLPLFSKPVPVEGFEPLILGLWGKHSATVLPPLAIMLVIIIGIMYNTFCHFLYRCQWRDFNSWSWHYKLSILPLCYNCLP